jgi:copper(I)-binding protein
VERDGEVMRMREVAAIPVPARGSVTLQPGGLHLMLIGLTAPLVVGDTIPVTLRFERAGEMRVMLAVQAAGARAPAARHSH